ncbi:MAG: type II toxin-antitoxin system HicB family antitoxin [Pseudomonadota bacterium]
MNIVTYKGYHGQFAYDMDADIFHGEVINLADIITFQGRSIDELKQALADSVEDYLAFCLEEGKAPQKPYSGRFNVRIAPDIHSRIVLEASRKGLSLNAWVAQTLSNAVV